MGLESRAATQLARHPKAGGQEGLVASRAGGSRALQAPLLLLACACMGRQLAARRARPSKPHPTCDQAVHRALQDMRNLIDAYMDVAFHPRLPTDPRIFQSEAWHYEMTKQASRRSSKTLSQHCVLPSRKQSCGETFVLGSHQLHAASRVGPTLDAFPAHNSAIWLWPKCRPPSVRHTKQLRLSATCSPASDAECPPAAGQPEH